MAVRVGRAAQAEVVRREVLAAAHEAFLAEGFHGATLERIAAAAGYTKGAVYSRFESKADLFLALLEERIEGRIEQNRRLAEGLHGVDGLMELAARWTELQQQGMAWTLLVLEFRVHAARQPELLARYASLHERTLAGIAAVFARVLDGDEASAADQLEAARLLFASGNGAVLEQAVDPGAVGPEQVRVLVRSLMAEVAAR